MEYLEKLEELDQVPWRTLCLFSAFPPPIDLGRNPSNVQCQHCFKNVCQIKLCAGIPNFRFELTLSIQITTDVIYKIGTGSWAVCLILSLVGCWPCNFISCCFNQFKDVLHRCPICNKTVHSTSYFLH